MGILNDALAYVGKVAYGFGKNDVEGGVADCSAFTQYVFRKNGYEIGRDTRSQIQKGAEVKYNNLKPGDLVFFQGTYRQGVSHVGIYVGNGKMVNCQSSDGVAVDDITKGYWKDHYMTARRVADAADVGGNSPADGGTSNEGGNSTMSPENVTVVEPVDLAWWGDALVIIFMILCLVAAIFFLYKAFETQIMATVNPVKDLKNELAKLLKAAEQGSKEGEE